MKNDEEIFFKIEDYLQGKLPPEETAAFEQEIAADPELAETVEMQRFEREGLEFMLGENLLQKLKDWESSPPPDDLEPGLKKQTRPRKWWLVFPATLLAGMLAIFFFRQDPSETPAVLPGENEPSNLTDTTLQKQGDSTQTIKNQPIYATEKNQQEKNQPETQRFNPQVSELVLAYQERSPNLETGNLKGGSGEKNVLTPIQEALNQSKPDYQKAIADLEKIKREKYPKEFDQAQELLAHAYFNLKRFDLAAPIYQKMTRQDLPAAEHDLAEWNLLLSLLPDPRQKKPADELLEKMTNPANSFEYYDEAIRLKEALAKIQR